MASNRIVKYFGVHIPPFKESKMETGQTTIRFVVTGKIPSKKNSSSAVVVRKDARAHLKEHSKDGMISIKEAQKAIGLTRGKIMPNLEYNAWRDKMKPVIQEQTKFWMDRLQEKGLMFPLYFCHISIRFYINNEYFLDSISKEESILDLLVDCKVLADDNRFVLPDRKTKAAGYKDELLESICYVTISFPLKKGVNYEYKHKKVK